MEDLQHELDLLRPQILNGTPIRLSYSGTRWTTIAAFIFSLIFAILITSTLLNDDTPTRVYIAVLLALVLLGLTTYQLVFSAVADLEGKKLTISKLFGKTETIDVSQIVSISGFTMRRTAYSNIRYKNADGIESKALILNSNSALFGVEVPASEVLKLAQTL